MSKLSGWFKKTPVEVPPTPVSAPAKYRSRLTVYFIPKKNPLDLFAPDEEGEFIMEKNWIPVLNWMIKDNSECFLVTHSAGAYLLRRSTIFSMEVTKVKDIRNE